MILIWKKARRHAAGEEPARQAKGHERRDHDDGLSQECSAPTNVALGRAPECAVERIEKSSQQSPALPTGPQQQRGERWAERERVKRGKQNGNRDRHRELLVELAGDSGNKRRWYKDRGENQRDADNGSGKLVHRFQRRVLRRHALLDVPLDTFDHDDRVVHHQADCQHQPEKRQRVDRKTEDLHYEERADQ